MSDQNPLLQPMLAAIGNGISVIPAQPDKQPRFDLLPGGSWKEYQTRIATEEEVRVWCSQGLEAFAVVCGKVSGGLVVLDFDYPGFLQRWADSSGNLTRGLPCQRTGSVEVRHHVFMRCPEPLGNVKLAHVVDESEEGGRRAAIETRGEGGYALVAPSLHKSGRHYQWLTNLTAADTPHVPQAVADALLAAARKLDEAPFTKEELHRQEQLATEALSRKSKPKMGEGVSVIHAFNQAHSIEEILLRYGYERSWNGRLVRPGGTTPSVSIKDGHSCHFSTDDPLNDGKVRSGMGCHDAFDVYCHYEHGGDVSRAVKAAAQLLGMSYQTHDVGGASNTNAGIEQETAPVILSIRQLRQRYPNHKPPRIDGLLRVGEVMNVISAPKTYKSFLVNDLALCVATGRPWLERFVTHAAPVLIIDNELHPETSSQRIPKIADARGIPFDEYGDRLFIQNQRGSLKDIYRLGSLFEKFGQGQYGLIILDAFYRFLPPKTDENSNGEIASIYNFLDGWAGQLQTSFVLVHHTSKGIQGHKDVTDVGAGAGSQSRAADSHVVLRRHEAEGVVVLDGVLRSWPPIDPICLQWDYPRWRVAGEFDPADLRREGKRGGKKKEASLVTEAAEPEVKWTVESFCHAFLSREPKLEDLIVVEAEAHGLSERKARRFLNLALSLGSAHRWNYGPNQKTRYATIEQPLTAIPAQDAQGGCAHTHSPHTPQTGRERPSGVGVVRARQRKQEAK